MASITPGVFSAIMRRDIEAVMGACVQDVEFVLPLLARCVLCTSLDGRLNWKASKESLMQILLNYPEMNTIVDYLSTDFQEVLSDCSRELALRKKQSSLGNHIEILDALFELERRDSSWVFKTVISELLWLMNGVEQRNHGDPEASPFNISTLFQTPLLYGYVSNLMCIAVHELPSLLPICAVVEALLRLENATNFIVKLVINCPWTVHEVCCSLVRNDQDCDTCLRERRLETLKALCTVCPSCVLPVCELCAKECKLPQFMAWVYLERKERATILDVAELVFSHRNITKALFGSKGQGHSDEPEILSVVRAILVRELSTLAEDGITDANYMRAVILIKLFASLREIISYRLSDRESEMFLHLFSGLPLNSGKMMHLTILALCLMVASVQQLAQYSQKLSSWLRSLAQNTSLYAHCGNESVGQLLLLIAIHYHSNQLSTISDIVASYLNIKASSVKLSNTILKQIVTYEVFTEPVISRLTVQLAVTKGLSDTLKGFLPIHSVNTLLKSRAFSKHNVTICDWIFDQLCHLSLPLHPMVCQLIRNYIATTMPQQHSAKGLNPPLEESRLLEFFRLDPDKHFMSQLSLLFYVLSHQEALQCEPNLAAKRKFVKPYSNDFLAAIPTKLLMNKAYKHRRECSSLYPYLMKLLYSNYPHLCVPCMWLPETRMHCRPNHLVRMFKSRVPEQGGSLYHLYLRLRLAAERISGNTLPVLVETLRAVQSHNQDKIPQHVFAVLKETWIAYSRVMPERLYTETMNALRDGMYRVTEEQLVVDPLMVLQSLPDIKHPVILSIVLHLVEVFCKASSRYYDTLAQARCAPGPAALVDALEISYSLLAAQESAVVQILLEQCLLKEDKCSLLSDNREIQSLICSHVHKAVIENPNLAKLISFQGFHHSLIPLIVAGVPSAHICLDFIPELLAQASIHKQVFAVRLTAALCAQYPVHKTYNMARLCLNTLVTLVGVLSVDSIMRYIFPLMSDVLAMCQCMPLLYEDRIQLMALMIPLISAYSSSNTLGFMMPSKKRKGLELLQ